MKWPLKSEEETFSIKDLIAQKNQTTLWDGVRSYRARNYLKMMNANDQAFFYYSSCKEPAIVAIVSILGSSIEDKSALDVKSQYYDKKLINNKPNPWVCVPVKMESVLNKVITLKQMKLTNELSDFILLAKGNRLSVLPVNEKQWSIIIKLSQF